MIKTLAEIRTKFSTGDTPSGQDIVDFIDTLGDKGGSTPTGAIVRSGSIAPTGCIRCDGSLLSTTTYADLYAKIGEQYSYRINNGQPWKNQWDINYAQTGLITGWVAGTALAAALGWSQAVVTKSRVYLLGGITTGYDKLVYTAPINSDGTLGAWAAGTSLPASRVLSQAIMTNSRVYMLGGKQNGLGQAADYIATVITAPVNSDGTLGTWTSSPSLPAAIGESCAVVTKSRVYLLGGSTFAGLSSTVYTAPINSDGTIGAWTTDASSLPVALSQSSQIVTNSRVYLLGGLASTGSNNIAYSAPINADGTLGSWASSGSCPAVKQSQAVVVNNRAYLLGGVNSAGADSAATWTAQVNPDGTLGSWVAGAALTGVTKLAQVIVTSSKIYMLGGWPGIASTASVKVASFAGGSDNYMDKSYVAVPGTGQFRIPDLTQQDLRTPGLYSYIKI
jgi:N-acetylneuraminic acid mutarotase